MLSRNKGEPFLHRIVTRDEKWILYDNRKHSTSWSDTDEASKHSPKPNIHEKELMVTAWRSSHSLIHYSFIKSRLLHDNTRPHTANRTQLKILESDLETIDYPLYSPNLSPTDYHLFRNLNKFLQEKIFNSQQAVENSFRAFIGSRSLGFYAKRINELLLKSQKY